MLIARSAATGLNSFTVSPDYMVSVVEGLKPVVVSGMRLEEGLGQALSTERGGIRAGDWIHRVRSLVHAVACANAGISKKLCPCTVSYVFQKIRVTVTVQYKVSSVCVCVM